MNALGVRASKGDAAAAATDLQRSAETTDKEEDDDEDAVRAAQEAEEEEDDEEGDVFEPSRSSPVDVTSVQSESRGDTSSVAGNVLKPPSELVDDDMYEDSEATVL